VWRLLTDASTGGPDWTWLSQGGAIGILATCVLGFVRGWVVPGSDYRRVVAERDKALEQVYKQAEIAQRALEAAERSAAR
jgi:hypothetical protein